MTEKPDLRDPNKEDGIFFGLSYDDYAKVDAINQTYLNQFAKSPKHARYWELQGRAEAPSEAKKFGSAVHYAILEPQRYVDEVCIRPKNLDGRGKAQELARINFNRKLAETGGKIVLSEEENNDVRQMAAAIIDQPTAREIFASPGRNEVSLVWTHRSSGVRCKARIDRLARVIKTRVAADLKSSQDCGARGFQGSVVSYGYHVQAAHALMGLQQLSPVASGFPAVWEWIVIEKEPPYDCGVWQFSDGGVEISMELVEGYLQSIADCRESNRWPGKCPSGAEYMDLPEWFYKKAGKK